MYFISELRREINAAGQNEIVEDALRVLDDISHKFELYQGHRVRVAYQQKHISKLFQELEDECCTNGTASRAVLTIDWKMKFEAKSARETAQQHYAKRGMSWHGCLISYFRMKTTTYVQADGTTAAKTVPERVNVYIDQILDGDNKQDAFAVGSMLEAALEQIHKQIPEIKSVIVQSDNAKCYNNNILRILTALINTRTPVKVERHIFTETQDGKGLIDAHFARGMSHVLKFMRNSQRNRIRAIATPTGLAHALAWGGGIANSCVQLVRLDRRKLDDLKALLTKPKTCLNKFFARCNDVVYPTSTPPTRTSWCRSPT